MSSRLTPFWKPVIRLVNTQHAASALNCMQSNQSLFKLLLVQLNAFRQQFLLIRWWRMWLRQLLTVFGYCIDSEMCFIVMWLQHASRGEPSAFKRIMKKKKTPSICFQQVQIFDRKCWFTWIWKTSRNDLLNTTLNEPFIFVPIPIIIPLVFLLVFRLFQRQTSCPGTGLFQRQTSGPDVLVCSRDRLVVLVLVCSRVRPVVLMDNTGLFQLEQTRRKGLCVGGQLI